MGCFFKGHDWVQIEKTVSPAPMRIGKVGSAQGLGSDIPNLLRIQFEAFERDSRAVTCFLFQCSVCKEIRKEELWGVVEEKT